jgi:aminomethyltransferase
MVPFSGWLMPVQYTGIIGEHLHTREKAGLFDVCHMGEFFIKGEAATQDVERLVTCRVGDMRDGRCRYGLMLNDSGGIIDDLIVFRINAAEYMLVVNAGTAARDAAWIKAHISPGTVFVDDSENTAKIDIQGPVSGELLERVADKTLLRSLGRFSFARTDICGTPALLSRTGYTGENGYEIFIPSRAAKKMWELLMGLKGTEPAGLGARDTLRLEMGYCLYGSDIDEEHTPLEAGLGRFVDMEKDFTGRTALAGQLKNGIGRSLTGFVCEGRRSARRGFDVLDGDRPAGKVTSGAFSPCLKKGIGMCYVDNARAKPGAEVTLTDGKTEIKAVLRGFPLLEKTFKKEA